MSLHLGEASRSTAQRLLAQGIPFYDQPEIDHPRLPEDITAIDDEGLMMLYTLLVAWSDFYATQVVCARIDERAAQAKVDKAEQELMADSGDKGDRVTFARARVAADPMIVALKQELEVIKAYKDWIQINAENVERDSSLVSRELTRRTSSRSRTPADRWSA